MKVFVAGATGVIGWRATRELVAAGHQVTAMARSASKRALVEQLGASPVEVGLIDPAFDPAALEAAVAGHDVVVNLATKIPPPSQSMRASAWAENDRIRTQGSRRLVDAALAGGVRRYIQESIAFIYGDHGDAWIDESEPLLDTPFTAAVRAAEAQAARFSELGGTGVVLRFGVFYSADSRHTIDLLRWARRGRLLLPGPADAYLPMIQLDDAARAVVAALAVPSGTYHVVDDEPLRRIEVAEVLADALDRRRVKLPPRWFARLMGSKAPQFLASQRVSNARFENVSGWTPRFRSFRSGGPAVVAELKGGGPRAVGVPTTSPRLVD